MIPIATGKPTSSASAARRARSRRRCTSATASAASGPNSGPSTIAPTTVTVESVTAPIAASRQARVRNITKVTVSVDSSAGPRDQLIPDHGVGRVALGVVLGPMRLGRQHRVEHFQRDRAPVLDVERLEFPDQIVGALAGDIGGDLVTLGFERGTGVQQQIGHPDLAAQHAEHRRRAAPPARSPVSAARGADYQRLRWPRVNSS